MAIMDLVSGNVIEPLTIGALAGDRAIEPSDVLALAERHGARWSTGWSLATRRPCCSSTPSETDRRPCASPCTPRPEGRATYVEFRREQSDRVKVRPHPYEFPLYFDG